MFVQASFYASGFLYSLKTHQILLLKSQLKDSTDFLWSTFGGKSSGGEEAQSAFQRIINKLLNINLKTRVIHPVYDYFSDSKNKLNYVFYAEVKHTKKFDPFMGGIFSWVAFDEISKLLFTSGTKQDVIVGQRVINAKWRDDVAKKLLVI